MEKIGSVYQIWSSSVNEGVRYLELQALKHALREDHFRWRESSAHSKLEIHDGGDSMSDDSYKVGELEGNRISVFGSSRLEDFLEKYG